MKTCLSEMLRVLLGVFVVFGFAFIGMKLEEREAEKRHTRYLRCLVTTNNTPIICSFNAAFKGDD
jgi:hypothetical protein